LVGAQLQCINHEGQLIIEDSPGISNGIKVILQDNGQKRWVGLNRMYNSDLTGTVPVWQNGHIASLPTPTCAAFAMDFSTPGKFHKDVDSETYVIANPSPIPTKIGCQFVGPNLARGQTTSARATSNANLGSENVILIHFNKIMEHKNFSNTISVV